LIKYSTELENAYLSDGAHDERQVPYFKEFKRLGRVAVQSHIADADPYMGEAKASELPEDVINAINKDEDIWIPGLWYLYKDGKLLREYGRRGLNGIGTTKGAVERKRKREDEEREEMSKR